MKFNRIKNSLFVFVLCLSVVLPSFISEVTTTDSLISQDNDIQLSTLSVDDPIGGGTFVINAPTPSSPPNGVITYDRTVTITWEEVAISNDYNLVVDNNADFSSPIVNVNTGASESYTTGYLSEGKYYWHVRNHWLLWGAFSATWDFTVEGTPPALVSPPNGLVTMDTTPYLDWNSVAGANLYLLQLDDNPSFSSPYTAQTASTYITSPTLSNGNWYWRVRARDTTSYWGIYSSIRYFTVDTSPPSAPILLTPINGKITNDNSPYFSWNPVSTAVLYRIQVALNSGFTSGVWSTTTGSTSYSSVSFSDGLRYWRVQARDAVGNWGSYSSYRTFTVDTVAPAQPVIVSPDDGLLDSDPTVFLDWDPVAGVTQYDLHIADNAGFVSPFIDLATGGTGYITSSLADGEYFWRVRAMDPAFNYGPWNTRSFIVDTTAPTITAVDNDPIIPTDAETVTISCDVTDLNGVSIVYLVYRINGGSWSWVTMAYDTGNTYEATIGTFFYADEIEYYVSAEDNAETENVATEDAGGLYYSFTVVSSDVTAPLISYSSRNPFNPDDTEAVTILCDVTDLNDIQTVLLYYRINGGSNISIPMLLDFGDRYNVTIGPFAYGDLIEYYITATDDSPNHNVKTLLNFDGGYFSFTPLSSDDSGPTISDVQNEPLIPTDTQTVNITCSVIDPNGIHNVTLFYRVDSGVWTNISMTLLSGDTYNATIGTFNYGEQIEYYIYALDDYVLLNAATEDNSGLYYTFTILSGDVTPPEITNISHSPSTPNQLDMVTFSCDVTDVSGIQAVYIYYRVDGGSWTQIGMGHTTGTDTYSVNIGVFSYSSFVEYCIRAYDNSPNHNTVLDDNGGLNYSFTVVSSDTTNPTIDAVEYDPTAPTELDSINVTCYAFDASGLDYIALYYRVNGGSWVNVDMTLLSNDIYGVVLDPFNVGELVEFYITATDNSVAQNIATDDNGGLYYTFTI
ncbi:MAG: hypothetical protein ACTSR1_07240, partial [Candidatus Heimdallarchaeota archaeon]